MSSKSSSSQCSSSMNTGTSGEDRPLLMMTSTLKNGTTTTHTVNKSEVVMSGQSAREWPCAACGCLLGILHLSLGVALLLFDVLTNSVSQTAFAITASLTYIICALLCFIAVRRLDRCAQILLMCFAVFASVASISIFLESSVQLNAECVDGAMVVPIEPKENSLETLEEVAESLRDAFTPQQMSLSKSRNAPQLCSPTTHGVLSALITIALSEFVVCIATLIVCFRSLQAAYGVARARSPYSTLIVGDLKSLERGRTTSHSSSAGKQPYLH